MFALFDTNLKSLLISIKKANRSILFQSNAIWKENSNGTVNFNRAKHAYLRYIQFRVLHNRLVTQTLLHRMGKSESESCLFCKEKDSQEHVLLYCPSTIQPRSEIKCLAISSHPL